ncbi:MAG: LemA family protein [Elusimicrobiales bacterium]|nr:LemA family protein [Elusimicrobiales bacterium]
MANELDEMSATTNPAGHDIHVIEKQLPVRTGFGSVLFEILLWTGGPALTILFINVFNVDYANMEMFSSVSPKITLFFFLLVSMSPGIIFIFKKISAANYFRQLQQKLQADASNIDNYLEQRVRILENVAALVSKATELDKDVMKAVAAFRSGIKGTERNEASAQIDGAFSRLFPQVEAYPELKSHAAIADAMQQNSYLQKEITAARTVYNDTVTQWNTDIYEWPTKMIVASRAGYTTRIPFTASAEIKDKAGKVFF